MSVPWSLRPPARTQAAIPLATQGTPSEGPWRAGAATSERPATTETAEFSAATRTGPQQGVPAGTEARRDLAGRAQALRAQKQADPAAAQLAQRLHEALPRDGGEVSVAGATVAGATVAGATVAGATVAGATVAGATVAGATVAGATVPGATMPRSTAHAELARRVADIAREEASEGPWSAPDGMCLDLAAKWQVRLAAEGIPARIATVDPARRADGEGAEKGMEGKFHAFVLVEAPGAEPLIVDGSWRQFIAGAEHKPEIPGIFVGTLGDLREALAPHQAALQVEIHDDPLLGKRDPRATVDLAYGAGPHAHLREVLGAP